MAHPYEGVTEDEKREAAEAMARHPGWKISRVFGGWEAVPEGTAVHRAMFLDALEEKLPPAGGPPA